LEPYGDPKVALPGSGKLTCGVALKSWKI